MTENKLYIQAFKISRFENKQIAAAIGISGYGKHSLYLLNMNNWTSRRINQGTSASKVFWSPSDQYLVVLCSYEGNWFININLTNGNVIDNCYLQNPKNKDLWRLDGEPSWIDGTDKLRFGVKEFCNYDNRDCRGPDGNKVLAVYDVRLDAATLNISYSKKKQ